MVKLTAVLEAWWEEFCNSNPGCSRFERLNLFFCFGRLAIKFGEVDTLGDLRARQLMKTMKKNHGKGGVCFPLKYGITVARA